MNYDFKRGGYFGPCEHCKREFRASRPDAKFCGANCRKAYSRRFDGVTTADEKALDRIVELSGYLTSADSEVRDKAQKSLESLKATIDSVLWSPVTPAAVTRPASARNVTKRSLTAKRSK
jgi:hypothetical protein